MFVEAWRDYVLQHRYGRDNPQTIALNCCRCGNSSSLPGISMNLVTYCKENLGIETIHTENIILDFYSFEIDEINKGTNLSRLTQSMKQLELGEHVSPTYTPLFTKLYNKIIVQSQRYLHLLNEYTIATATPMAVEHQQQQHNSNQGDTQMMTKKHGRKRRVPDDIVKLYKEETRLRNMWYEQKKQQEQQQQVSCEPSTHYIFHTLLFLSVGT